MLMGLSTVAFGYAVVAVFLAAVIRGYTGFGFSALVVTSLSLVLSPAQVVPTAFLLEVAASIHMLPLVWRLIDRATLGWLLLGAAFATPVGVRLLSTIPVTPLRVIVALLVLAATLAIASGWHASSSPGRPLKIGTGVVSGTANGIAAIGGLPVVIFLLSTGASAAVTRATLVAFLLVTDIYGALLAMGEGLFGADVLWRTVVFLVPLVLGVAVGHRGFQRGQPQSFRRFAIGLLVALSCMVMIRAWLG